MTASDGSIGRLRGSVRRLLGRPDPAAAAQQVAALDDIRTELAAVREDLVAVAAAGDRTGDRVEALAQRLDDLTRQVAALTPPPSDPSGDTAGDAT